MNKRFHYSLWTKFCFYLSYFIYKLIIPFEVKQPRWKIWYYEFLYSLAKIKDYQSNVTWKYAIDTIQTRFGKFKIRPNTSDAANVSPAFERLDINYLIKLLKSLLQTNKKILFLDIGADIGSYSVLVANCFRHSSVRIKTFEPIPSSCLLIKENLALNKIEEKVQLYPLALAEESSKSRQITLDLNTPGSSSMKNNNIGTQSQNLEIEMKKLDDILKNEPSIDDILIMKIDVEGMEKNVLQGAQKALQFYEKVYVMVEDFIDQEIIQYLQEEQWIFLKKVTDYNSWWYLENYTNPR